MISSRSLGLGEGRRVTSGSPSVASNAARGGRRVLIGLAAAAGVLTAGCAPAVTVGGGHTGPTNRPAASGRLTYLPAADSFIYAGADDRNMGSNPRLVASSNPDQKTAFLKFEVSGIPAGGRVTAHLVLHRTDHHLPSSLGISTAGSNWSEMGITGRNAPRSAPW